MDTIKLLIMAKDSQTRARLAKAAEGPEVELIDSFAPSQAVLPRVSGVAADALVVYGNEEELFSLTERIYVSRSGLAVVMIFDEPNAALLEKAMDAGAAKVLRLSEAEDTLLATLRGCVAREKNRAQAPAESGLCESRVYSVFGTKGGSGKTMLAVNLAVALAQKGKRSAVVDFDLQFGDVGVFLDVDKSDTVADLVQENAFDYPSMKSFLFSHPSGVRGLCAPASPEYAELILPEHITKIIAGLKPRCDALLLDLPPAFSDASIAALEASDVIYYLLCPDISTLRSGKVGLSVLESLNLSDRVKLVLNRDGCSSISRKDIEGIMERPVELVIPEDTQRAVRAVNRGVPLVSGDRRCPIARAILDYADKMQLGAPAEKKGGK